MKTTIRNTALASILFAAASGAAFAADTVDLKVTGKITPAACNVTLSGGGIVDFGSVAASNITDTAPTALPDKYVTTTVTCDAAAKIGLKIIDGRRGTATSNDVGLAGYATPAQYFGFGEVSGKKLGGYTISMSPYNSIDGTDASNISSSDNAVSWATGAGSRFSKGDGSVISALAARGTTTPAAGKVFSFGFDVRGALEKKANLPALTSEVLLDGQATFSVVYL